jgi:ribonuclease BN (tRNA processing enzyme)
MKLKKEYLGLKGQEIRVLKEKNVEIAEEVVIKKFAYVCDTTINVFKLNPTLLDYPTIFIECTFLYEEELEMASGKKHIHFSELRPYIEAHPNIEFMLFHFSQRYKDAEIEAFLEPFNFGNLHWWIGVAAPP